VSQAFFYCFYEKVCVTCTNFFNFRCGRHHGEKPGQPVAVIYVSTYIFKTTYQGTAILNLGFIGVIHKSGSGSKKGKFDADADPERPSLGQI